MGENEAILFCIKLKRFFSYLINSILSLFVGGRPPVQNEVQFYFYGNQYKQALLPFCIVLKVFSDVIIECQILFLSSESNICNKKLTEIFII